MRVLPILKYLFPILLLLLSFHFTGDRVFAADEKVYVGGFSLSVAEGYPEGDLEVDFGVVDNQDHSNIIKKYTVTSPGNRCGSFLGFPVRPRGPCIGETYVPANAIGTTSIQILEIRRVVNGVVNGRFTNDSVDNDDINPVPDTAAQFFNLSPGGKTGALKYIWEAKVAVASIKVLSKITLPGDKAPRPQVKTGESVEVTVTVPPPLSNEYLIKFSRESADSVDATLASPLVKLNCSSGNCQPNIISPNLASNALFKDGKLTFDVKVPTATPPNTTWTFEVTYQQLEAKDGRVVSTLEITDGKPSDFVVSLSPDTIRTSETKKAKLTATLRGITKDIYQIYVDGGPGVGRELAAITCNSDNCVVGFSLPDSILAAGSHDLLAIGKDTKKIGKARLTVKDDLARKSNATTCKKGDPGCTQSSGQECNPANGKPGVGGVMTAIGCIATDPNVLVPKALTVVFGVAGGIAFLLMVFGVFQMITSAGNPDGVKKGWEQLGAAIQGLLVILFAVLLLQIIGFDILGLPGFNSK